MMAVLITISIIVGLGSLLGFVMWIAKINGKAEREEQKKIAAIMTAGKCKNAMQFAADIKKETDEVFNQPVSAKEINDAWKEIYDE